MHEYGHDRNGFTRSDHHDLSSLTRGLEQEKDVCVSWRAGMWPGRHGTDMSLHKPEDALLIGVLVSVNSPMKWIATHTDSNVEGYLQIVSE
jgi:hypothetical protein